MATELARDPRVTVLNEVVLNQALVRFSCAGKNITHRVTDAAQRDGTCWMGGTEWGGEPAMRISVCNARTTKDDIRRSVSSRLAQLKVSAPAPT